jgi:hypothetical protein
MTSTPTLNYKSACGDAFEDLAPEEMMDFDGGATWSPTPLISSSTVACVAGFSVSVVAVTVVSWIRG